MQRSIVILGLGYVGFPLASAFAESGVSVVGFDTDSAVVERLLASEDDSDSRVLAMRAMRPDARERLHFTSNANEIRGSQAYVICVPTPLGPDGYPDLSAVDEAVLSVGKVVERGALVVLESTTYPGTTEERVKPLLERHSGLQVGSELLLAYSPERIDPGNVTFTVTNTPKIVAGVDRASLDRARELYLLLGVEVVEARGTREAELAKLLENTYRQVNIALVNEMLKFCSAMNIDLYDAIRCASSKPFGFQAFWPGPGVGGHCIPIDPKYLSFRVAAELGYPFRFVELAQEVNGSMPAFVVGRVQRLLNDRGRSVRGSRIALFGVAYKANVADTRETPATGVARQLIQMGAAVSYIDPFVPRWQVDGESIARLDVEVLLRDPVDCAILLQAHEPFLDLDWELMATQVLDTQGVIQHPSVSRLCP